VRDLHALVGKARSARAALKATSRLTDFEINEVSLVAAGANLRRFAVVKRASSLAAKIAKARAVRATLPPREAERTVPISALVTKATANGGELRFILCAVLVPEEVDAQGDIYSADEIRKAAWGYARNFRNIGLEHKGLLPPDRAVMVESFLIYDDDGMTVAGSHFTKGTWVLGVQVFDDKLWGDVKAGRITGLSIGGWARKNPVRS
jgi:hypothetical protein